ncbi:MAG TPA: tRNA uridine-5-carboxymethylaminomethyl(34) synthesis GTPase MnmE [Thermopetrobacter sp.]|nr:tRNA uridine-5-carboxymethylaminomethyl(34) synthesis GTPase MnmE [Thermopetrobacter sp.]
MSDRADETIFALSSGAGMAAVAVIRISGGRAGDALRALTGRPPPAARQAALRRLRDPADGTLLDEALVIRMPGPASFTGEDVVELHVHGGVATVRRLLAVLAEMDGLRPAAAGEFTRRAFLNGRMTLMEVEGLADLIAAETEAQRRLALAASSGRTTRRVEEWRLALTTVLAELEAMIDFADEEDVADDVDSPLKRLRVLTRKFDKALGEAAKAARLRHGLRVVLAGPPNAGKSTLLNALAGREAAIVAAQPGTTRDVIEVHMQLSGLPVTLCDTAGLRDAAQTDDAIERVGQDKARNLLREADLVLWVEAPDVAARDKPAFDSPSIRLLSKADLFDSDSLRSLSERYDLAVSARTGVGLEALEHTIGERLRERFDVVEAPVVSHQRQVAALGRARRHVDAAATALERGMPAEVAAEEARLAGLALERLVGRVDVEDVLEVIFSRFCIGK